MTKLTLAVLAGALALTPRAVRAQDQAAADAASWDARLTSASGAVTVYPVESPDQPVAGQAGMPLADGDRVETGADGSAELAFDGGGVVAVESGSQLTLSSLEKAKAELKLAFGGFVAKFHSLLPEQNLSVRTPSAVAAVRGTEFGVQAGKDGATSVGVFDEGKVAVDGQGGGSQLVTANQETSVSAGGSPIPPRALGAGFRARRARLRRLRRSLARVARTWKALPREERARLRRGALERRDERREERRQDLREQRHERREQRRDERRERREGRSR